MCDCSDIVVWHESWDNNSILTLHCCISVIYWIWKGPGCKRSTLAKQFPFQNWCFSEKLIASTPSVKNTLYSSLCFYVYLYWNTWLGVYSLNVTEMSSYWSEMTIWALKVSGSPNRPEFPEWLLDTQRHLCLKVEISCCSGEMKKFP